MFSEPSSQSYIVLRISAHSSQSCPVLVRTRERGTRRGNERTQARVTRRACRNAPPALVISVPSSRSCPVLVFCVHSSQSCPFLMLSLPSSQSCPFLMLSLPSSQSCPVLMFTVPSSQSCPVLGSSSRWTPSYRSRKSSLIKQIFYQIALYCLFPFKYLCKKHIFFLKEGTFCYLGSWSWSFRKTFKTKTQILKYSPNSQYFKFFKFITIRNSVWSRSAIYVLL